MVKSSTKSLCEQCSRPICHYTGWLIGIPLLDYKKTPINLLGRTIPELIINQQTGVHSGKHTKNYGKSLFLMGQLTIHGETSTNRVFLNKIPMWLKKFWSLITGNHWICWLWMSLWKSLSKPRLCKAPSSAFTSSAPPRGCFRSSWSSRSSRSSVSRRCLAQALAFLGILHGKMIKIPLLPSGYD